MPKENVKMIIMNLYFEKEYMFCKSGKCVKKLGIQIFTWFDDSKIPVTIAVFG